MSYHAFVGNTFQNSLSLRAPAIIVNSLQDSNPTEWNAPAKLRLVDMNGSVWHESHLENPQPRILGADYVFDYDIELTIPEMESGTYYLQLSRWTVSNNLNIEIEGLARQAYGAENVLALVTDSNVHWTLVDENPDAEVTWSLAYRRVTGETDRLTGDTTKTLMGSDSVHTSNLNFSPSLQGISASLVPLTLVWDVKENANIAPRRQSSSLFIVNDSQLAFITELKGFFERLCEERRLPALEYSMADYANWANAGMSMFNAGGLFTGFDMTDATESIRYWWSVCSIICALRNMYMLEGARSFSFSGQSTTLDVDITQYLDSLKSDLQGQWDSDKLSYKQQLKTYGLTGGSGNMSQARFQVGALGLSLGPSSNLGGYFFGRSFFNGLRFY